MANESFFKRYKLHHVLFWSVVFIAWFYLRKPDYSATSTALTITAIKVIDLVLMIYFTNYVLIPKLLYKKKYFWFFSSFFIMVVGSSVLKMNIIGRVLNAPQMYDFSHIAGLRTRIYDNVIPHFFLVIAGIAVKLVSDYMAMLKRMVEMAKEKAEAELNFLKSQINPHFLFNSLNSVYFLINKDNTHARKALHKFSDMLRYQLYECADEKIPIEKEIAYLQDYVDLQKLRREQQDQVEFTCAPNVKGFSIEPLLLIPFVENSFKHLSHYSGEKKNLVKIEADRLNGDFLFRVSNTVEFSSVKEPVGGIGLKNVKRRLELLYPDRHQLKIDEEKGMFTVDLKINVDNK